MSANGFRDSLLQLPQIRDETYSRCFSETFLAFQPHYEQHDRTAPGGTIFRLPREIRDEIYSYCFSKAYTVFWSNFPPHGYDPHISDLAILRASKAISSEAKHSLFSKSASKSVIFKFDISVCYHEDLFTPSQEAIDRMTNVEFAVSFSLSLIILLKAEENLEDEWLNHMESICKPTLDRFSGTAVIRDNFRITFDISCIEYADTFRVLMKTPFVQTLKEFTGFQKLNVVLIRMLAFSGHVNELDMKIQEGVEAVQMELEAHLGSPIIKSARYNLYDSCGADLNIELEFQPRKFHLELLQAEAARVTEDMDRIEGQDLRASRESDL